MKGKGRGSRSILTSPPSAFRPNPTDNDVRSNARDSLLTQQSSTSSSLYPPTTSIGTESPPSSPLSPTTYDHGVIIPAFEIDGLPKVQEFDADDVQYRLQLLVKNNYFLPPAHSKPSPADLAPCVQSSKKATSPAFLDYFRVGKSKSKPSSPDSHDTGSPMLRVTSDSTTVSGYVPRGSPQVFRSPTSVQHLARVVVVREKMDDLVAAAKQAELDLKGRDVISDRDRGSRRHKVDVFDGIIDPTDAVDIPPPSANYTLALQASALHGLGIEDSVGAAVLAERLPPPCSPGHSISLDPHEEAWRKALLHEAVGHSLNNSAASLSIAPSTPTRSPRHLRSSESLYQRALMQQRKTLEKKIIENPIIDQNESEPPTPTAGIPSDGRDLVARLPPQEHRRLSNYTPVRAETPVPQTPLAPPPRRPLGNPQYSHSQSHLPSSSSEQRRLLRKSLSSPILSDFYDLREGSDWTRTPTMTPPPLPSLSISPPPSHRMSRMTALTGISRFTGSEHDEMPSRPSLALSLPTTDGGRRRSLSEYSQPSPTASAFRDRWSEGYHSTNSQLPPVDPVLHSRGSSASKPTPIPRLSTMSPPPRPSSSVAGIALSPPPPRSGHFPHQLRLAQLHEASSPTRSSSECSQGTFHSFHSFHSFPPVPSVHGTSNHLPLPLEVNISIDSFASGIHSAPPPSSPATFFDHIQSHPNAMDDLDDSSDDSRSDIQEMTAVYRDPQPSPHPSLMQLGNRSTPSIARTTDEPHHLAIPAERSQPVSNVPAKTPYFTSVKSSPNSLTYLTLAQHSQEHLTVDGLAPQRSNTAGSENVLRWQKDQQALAESTRKLDGMLIQHMETEKDTLRRIAQTAKVPKA